MLAESNGVISVVVVINESDSVLLQKPLRTEHAHRQIATHSRSIATTTLIQLVEETPSAI